MSMLQKIKQSIESIRTVNRKVLMSTPGNNVEVIDLSRISRVHTSPYGSGHQLIRVHYDDRKESYHLPDEVADALYKEIKDQLYTPSDINSPIKNE